ncbi:MAG: hypothetical protein IKU27_05685 [Clostridia bacterium]|nr:hypothetical protein [Clostridia bacterium]
MKRHPLVYPILALLPAFLLTWRAKATMLTPLLAVAVLLLLWYLQNRRSDVPVDTDKLTNEMLNDPFAMMTQMRTGQSVGHLPSRRGGLHLWTAVWGGYVACILMAELATGYEAPMDVTVYLPYLLWLLILMMQDWQSKMTWRSPIRFTYPYFTLSFSSYLLLWKADAVLTAPFIGLVAFTIVQWLYNTTKQPHHPDHGKELEQMTAAQMNDPSLAGASARGGDRGGAFLPTRDIRASDLQRATVGSWIVVVLTLLGSLAQLADRVDTLSFHSLSPFIPYILLITAGMLMERIDLYLERKGKQSNLTIVLLILLPICFLLFITDLPLVGYVVTGEGDANMAFGDFTLYPKWDTVTVTDVELTGDDPHLMADLAHPLRFTYDHYGTTEMAVHYRFLGMERTYYFDITIYPGTLVGRVYAWDRITQTDEFGHRVEGDLMEPPEQ